MKVIMLVLCSAAMLVRNSDPVSGLDMTGVEILRHLTESYKPTSDNILKKVQKKQPGPFKILPEWKNPCWLSDEKFLCIPYFYVMGFRKCATSDFYARLSLHPQVVQPWRKETYWITHSRRDRPMEVYADWFGARLFAKGAVDPGKFIMGDGDPNVVWHYQAQPSHTTPVPQLFKRISPDADYRFITLMRQPSKRVYSDYLYSDVADMSVEKFHQAVVMRVNDYNACFQLKSVRECVFNEPFSFGGDWNTGITIGHSIYVAYVHDWLVNFPREKFLFIETGEYSHNMAATLSKTFSFLGLDPLDNETISQMCALAQVNKNVARERLGDMLPETKAILDEFFQPLNDALALLVGSDLFTWSNTSIASILERELETKRRNAESLAPDSIAPQSLKKVVDPNIASVAESQKLPAVGTQKAAPLVSETKLTAPVVVESRKAAPVVIESQKVAPVVMETQKAAPVVIESQKVAPVVMETQKAAPVVIESQKVAPVVMETQKAAPVVIENQKAAPVASKTQYAAPVASKTHTVPVASETQYTAPIASKTQYAAPVASKTQYATPAVKDTRNAAPVVIDTERVAPVVIETQKAVPVASKT